MNFKYRSKELKEYVEAKQIECILSGYDEFKIEIKESEQDFFGKKKRYYFVSIYICLYNVDIDIFYLDVSLIEDMENGEITYLIKYDPMDSDEFGIERMFSTFDESRKYIDGVI